MPSPSGLFERLGAPLRNVQWSWGAQRASDGATFLRVWQDETVFIDGARFVRLVNHAAYAGDLSNHGYVERLRHLESLRKGVPGYVVICRAEDITARPRSIASFDSRDVVRLGRIEIHEGDEWGELAERVPVKSMVTR